MDIQIQESDIFVGYILKTAVKENSANDKTIFNTVETGDNRHLRDII